MACDLFVFVDAVRQALRVFCGDANTNGGKSLGKHSCYVAGSDVFGTDRVHNEGLSDGDWKVNDVVITP